MSAALLGMESMGEPTYQSLPLSITRPFLRIAGFFASLDLVSSMTASGLFKGLLGDFYVLLTPSVFVIVVAMLHYTIAPTKVHRTFAVAAALFLSIGAFELIVTAAIGGFPVRAGWQLVFGFLYPSVLLLMLSGCSEEKQLLFWRWFFIGLITYLIAGLAVLVYDGFIQFVKTLGLGSAVISLRFNHQDGLFFLVMGNANKTSNYLMLALLLGPMLLRLETGWTVGARPSRDRLLFKIFAVLAIVMMTLLFSRLIMLLMPIPIILNRRFFFDTRAGARTAAALFVGMIVIAYIRWYEQINFVVQYLLFSSFHGGEAQGLLGTGHVRFQQWEELASLMNTPDRLLLGLGYGSYGALIQCPDCGTHNLFLDHWAASGVYGVFILLGLIAYGSLKALTMRYWRMLAVFLVFFILAIREYSMAYLTYTSMGGLMFLAIFYSLLVIPTLKDRTLSLKTELPRHSPTP